MTEKSPFGKTPFPMKSFKDDCVFLSGYAFKGKDMGDIGYPVIKIKNIQNRRVSVDKSQFINLSTITSQLDKYKLKNLDILIAMTGEGSVGRVGRLYLNKGIKAYLNQRVGKFIPDEKNLNADFLYYVLSSEQYEKILFSAGSGSGQPNLSPTIIQSIEIPYPPYKLQRKIGKFLQLLDNKIENNIRMNEILKNMAHTIFKSWFVDFDPVHAKASGNTPAHMDAETAALFPSSFSDNGLPVGWSFSTIEENGDVITGKTPSTKRSEYYGNEYPFIKIPNMTSVWVTETETALSKAGHLTQSKKLLQRGTVIVSCIASPGKVSIVSKPSHTNQQVNAVVPNEECPTSWLYCALANLKSEIIGMASGGSVTANLNKGDFSLIKIIHSSNEIMNSFDKKVCSLIDKILSNDKENQTLAKLRDTLLPKLISGEIHVKDAEREMEAAI